MRLSDYEIEMFEMMDQENAAEEERLRQMEAEMWAILDAENQEEEDRDIELWHWIERENEREHDEDISIWFEVVEGDKSALSNFDKALDKAVTKQIEFNFLE